jgi:exopolysaccharide/PEP-CTERM locus tyrosine autokinase
MSKIEKALNRARSERALRPVSSASLPSVLESRQGEEEQASVMTVVSSQVTEPEARSRASAAIALMHEPHLLTRADLVQRRIIYPELGEDTAVDAFREIRTKILQKTHGHNCVIMVTAVSSGGGSSFISLNLGAAFAFDAAKTALLVECNLRNPSLHQLLPPMEGKATPGLIDYLENPSMDVADIMHSVGIERLRVITAGERGEVPSEYFTSFQMRRLVDSLKQRYPERFIIFDAPPMTQSADTQILSELCDYVLLVVPYGRATNTQIDACIKAIDSKKLLGVVLNDEPRVSKKQWLEFLRQPFAPLLEALARIRNRIRTSSDAAGPK